MNCDLSCDVIVNRCIVNVGGYYLCDSCFWNSPEIVECINVGNSWIRICDGSVELSYVC